MLYLKKKTEKEKHLSISLSKSWWYLQFLRYGAKNTEIGNFKSFFAPLPPKILKNEKFCWRYHHFTQVYQKLQSYHVQFLRYGMRQTEFFVILGHFLPLHLLPNDPENQNFKKEWKKCLEISSFYTYIRTINEDHIIYGSWNKRCDRQKFLSFWAIFCPFSPPDNQENQNFKTEKKKTPGNVIILHICTINDNYMMMYGSWDMQCDKRNIFVILDCFFPFYLPMNQENQNFETMKKTPEDIIILQIP